MAWCGFNQSMADGLRAFVLGQNLNPKLQPKESDVPLCGYNVDMAHGLSTFVLGQKEHSQQPTEENRMTFCGHNKDMAGGIDTFTGGLVVQTKKRATSEGVSIAEIPALEIEEIDALLAELQVSPKREKLAGVMAIGSLIRFFGLIQKNSC